MITKQTMLELFTALNQKLKENDIRGEICVVGGAAMTLAFNARIATQDVDAIFQPKKDMQLLAMDVGKEHNLNIDWLNDAVSIFIPDKKAETKKVILKLSHLTVWSPDAKYLLAMKSISARPTDIRDLEFLIHLLKITDPKTVFENIQDYYPQRKISAQSLNVILSIFDKE